MAAPQVSVAQKRTRFRIIAPPCASDPLVPVPHAIDELLRDSRTAEVADALLENGLEPGNLVRRQGLAVVLGVDRLQGALENVVRQRRARHDARVGVGRIQLVAAALAIESQRLDDLLAFGRPTGVLQTGWLISRGLHSRSEEH